MIRHALATDLPTLADSLAHAFREDPMMAWVYPDDATRYDRLREFMSLTVEVGLTRGHTYHVAEGNGVAVWGPPDVTFFDEVGGPRFAKLMSEQIGERAREVMTGLMKLLTAHPEDRPYFYLSTLGVHADHQGSGLGAELMTPMLERCDEQGLLAYLESSNVKNVPFYQRHGFQVIDEVPLAEGGPVVRPMRREPR